MNHKVTGAAAVALSAVMTVAGIAQGAAPASAATYATVKNVGTAAAGYYDYIGVNTEPMASGYNVLIGPNQTYSGAWSLYWGNAPYGVCVAYRKIAPTDTGWLYRLQTASGNLALYSGSYWVSERKMTATSHC